MFNIHVGLDQPAEYEIKIQGRLSASSGLGSSLADWFIGEVRFAYQAGGEDETITVLTGMVADQAALHGLIQHVRDLGLTLLYVDCLSGRASEK